MNRTSIVAIVVVLVSTAALAEQAQAPACPDFSRQLAMGIQATYDRDANAGFMRQLDQQVTDLKKELAAAEAKVTADDAIIKSLHGEPKKEEAPVAAPAKP